MSDEGLHNAVIHYFAMLDKARRVQRHAGYMGLDAGHADELYEAEDALRQVAGVEASGKVYLRAKETE